MAIDNLYVSVIVLDELEMFSCYRGEYFDRWDRFIRFAGISFTRLPVCWFNVQKVELQSVDGPLNAKGGRHITVPLYIGLRPGA